MSKRLPGPRHLEVTLHWPSDDSSESEDSYTHEYTVTKNDDEYLITELGQPGPFLKAKDVEILNKWIDGNYGDDKDRPWSVRPFEKIEFKFVIDGKLIQTKEADFYNYKEATMNMMKRL